MVIRVVWADSGHKFITIQTLNNHWSVDEMRQAILTAWDMMKTVRHRVDVIWDVRAGNHLPPNCLALSRWMLYTRPANFGDVVILGGTPEIKAINTIVVQTYRHLLNLNYQVLFVDSLDDVPAIAEQCTAL